MLWERRHNLHGMLVGFLYTKYRKRCCCLMWAHPHPGSFGWLYNYMLWTNSSSGKTHSTHRCWEMFINLNHGVLEWLCKNNGKLTQNLNTCCVSKCMANSKCCDKASFSVNEKFLSRAGREKLPVLSVWDRFMKLKTDFILERKQRKSVHKKVVFFFFHQNL